MQEYPQKPTIEKILKEAFSYWNRTLIFQIAYTLLYVSILFLVFYYFSTKFGVLEQMVSLVSNKSKDILGMQEKIKTLFAKPEFQKLSWFVLGAQVFLYPLNLGFYKIYRKLDLNEKVEFEDLFSGYLGVNFFIFASYFLFWQMIYSYASMTIILGIVWIFITLFSAPLMFFMDKRIFETINLNFKALKLYFIEILVCSMVALAFKYFGILTLIGGLVTVPFWNAMIYALYKNIFVEKE